MKGKSLPENAQRAGTIRAAVLAVEQAALSAVKLFVNYYIIPPKKKRPKWPLFHII